jgi:hypothetical protein
VQSPPIIVLPVQEGTFGVMFSIRSSAAVVPLAAICNIRLFH